MSGLTYAYAGSSPFIGVDRSGNKSIGAGLFGELTPGVGFGAGFGLQIDFPWFGDCTPFDISLIGSFSGRVGLAASGGASGNFNAGSKKCGCENSNENKNILNGQMEGDLSGYFLTFGATDNYPIVKGPDGTLDFGKANSGFNGDLPRNKVGSDGFGLGAGASAGLGGTGGISLGNLGRAVLNSMGF